MEKRNKIIYWVFTGLISALMLMSAGMYFFNNAEVKLVFAGLGFPAFIIYPLAIAKILGVIAIVTRKSKSLTEWAYAGFFFDLLLAISAHIAIEDGEHIPAIVGLVILLGSYFMSKKVFTSK